VLKVVEQKAQTKPQKTLYLFVKQANLPTQKLEEFRKDFIV
jgi:hypothetical protein